MSIKPKELHPHRDRTIFKKLYRDIFVGEMPEVHGSGPITGPLTSGRKGAIVRRVNDILRQGYDIKIGAFGDFDVRMDDSVYRKEYPYVSLIYKSKKKEDIRNLEVELIKRYQQSHPDKVQNISVARAGRLTTYDGYYCIYVVFK